MSAKQGFEMNHNYPAKYKATAPILTDGDDLTLLTDATGNQKITLGTSLDKTNDSITAYPKAGTPVNLTASGQILAAPGQILGFYVNSTSSGTIRISDALTATTPYLGAAATPAVGFHKFPASLVTGGYVTISGTIDVTFFVIAA